MNVKKYRSLFFVAYKASKNAPNSGGLKELFKDRWIALQRKRFLYKNKKALKKFHRDIKAYP